MAYNNRNRLLLIRNIQQLALKYYEQGRQDRGWQWVWKKHVYPVYPISYVVFCKYMKIKVDAGLKKLSQ